MTNKPIRVLHVIARLNVGGTSKYIMELANSLPRHGIETFIAAGHVQESEIEEFIGNDIALNRIKFLGRRINLIKDVLALRQLHQIIGELKPDIIHSHTFKAGLLTRIGKNSIPIMHTFHGHLLDDPEFSGIKSRVILIIEKILSREAVKLVCVGERVATELLAQGVGQPTQYLNIPPGVESLAITPRALALKRLGISNDGRMKIGWLARVTGVKNPLLALEVARKIPEAHFLLGGGGDMLETVREMAPSNVTVLGWVKAEDFLGASDIIFSTSENEGMPIALIEAQLAGLPVVATNVGGVSEIISNEETGLITQKDADSIMFGLNQLIQDNKKRNHMSDAAKIRAKSIFSVDAMVNSHVALYRSIMN